MPKLVVNTPQERRVLGLAGAVTIILLLADQGSKIAVEGSFALYDSRPLIPGYLSLTYVRNYGAAWSMLSGHGTLLLLIGLAVAAAAIWKFRHLAEGWIERYVALAMILAGIFGNSIDRLWRGAVTDFIDVHYYEVWRYPIFNVADMAICIGVGVFILSNLLRPGAAQQGKADDAER